MRVLVVHNRYSSRVPSGENLAVDDEVRWLREAGIEVETLEASNDDVVGAVGLGRLRHAGESVWSVSAQRATAAMLDRIDPDIVHVHNLFPQLSGSVPWTTSRHDVPLVWTVHNQRIECVAGTHFRESMPCNLCRPGWRVPGVRHRCYGGSSAASALITVSSSLFRRMARRRATAIVPSPAIRRWLVDSAGFPEARIRLKPNGVAAPENGIDATEPGRRRRYVFAGRLIHYKGVQLLLDAWRLNEGLEAELHILGDGPMADMVKAATDRDPRVVWHGQVQVAEMPEHLASARAIIVPSLWTEPFGRTAAEALAYGRPVITTGTGGLAEIIDESTGWVVPADPAALAAALREATGSDEAVDARGERGRRRYLEQFSPEATTHQLIRIYEEAGGNQRVRPR